MSQPRAPRTIHDDFEDIEGYVAATFARYERALVALIPTLEEPRVAEPDLALKLLRFLVETLAGFAIGATVGAVAREARRGFGQEVRGRVGLLLGRIIRDGSPAVTVSELAPPARFLRNLDRPMLDALGAQLLARLYRSIPEVRTYVSAVHAEITRTAPARLPTFGGVLERLTKDDASALAFSDQVTSGWQHYAAAVSKRRLARTLEARGNRNGEELWRTWTRRLGGPAVPDAPKQDDIVAEGFLLQIA
jgi:hypothetical protein